MKKFGLAIIFCLVLASAGLLACNQTPSYTVLFEGNGGILDSGKVSQRIKKGSSAIAPTFVKNGYSLSWDKPFNNITENITVTATWDIVTYTIVYHTDGGTDGGNPHEYDVETETFVLEESTKEEHIFVGWFEDYGYENKIEQIEEGSYGDLHLYARFVNLGGGTGTEDDPVVIDSMSAFRDFAMLVNEQISFENKYFVLGGNIDLGNMDWMPIGTSYFEFGYTCWFSGVFDGRGYTVSNFRITRPDVAIGLFGFSDGIIKNLTIDGFEILSEGSYIGGLVGFNQGKVEYCSALNGSLDITANSGNSSVGGLVGTNRGYIQDGYSFLEIAVNASATCFVGGLAGSSYEGKINNSTTICVITANGKNLAVGGLVGESDVTIVSSGATCNITLSGESVIAGGLVGVNYFGNIETCTTNASLVVAATLAVRTGGLAGANYGKITGSNANGSIAASEETKLSNANVGGIAGYSEGEIENSDSTVDIDMTFLNAENELCLGGLVGYSKKEITNCYSVAKLTVSVGEKISLGGLVGKNAAGITNSYAESEITGFADYCGGLIGRNEGYIIRCFSIAIIKINTNYLHSNVGGLIGFNSGEITDSFANVSIDVDSGFAATVGGLVGHNTGFVKNTYSVGELTLNVLGAVVGGLVGNNGSATLENCFTACRITIVTKNLSLVGGIVGNYGEEEDIVNNYRYNGQDISITDESDPLREPSNTVGEECTAANLSDKDFFTEVLGWSGTIWNLIDIDFLDGNYPTLI